MSQRAHVSGFVSGHDITIEVSLKTLKRFVEVREKLSYNDSTVLTAIVEESGKRPTKPLYDEQWLNRGLEYLEGAYGLQAVDLGRRPKRERFQ